MHSSCLQLIITRDQISREVLSSPELRQITGDLNPYDTTEMHCNEFFPNSTTSTLNTEYAASAQLATLLLESWSILLGLPFPSYLLDLSRALNAFSQDKGRTEDAVTCHGPNHFNGHAATLITRPSLCIFVAVSVAF